MFKKNISIASSRPVSGKDVKKLKKDVALNFPDVTGMTLLLLIDLDCNAVYRVEAEEFTPNTD